MRDEVDKVLKHLGKYGKWQFYIFALISVMYLFHPWPTFAITYQGAQPADYHCATPDEVDESLALPLGDKTCEQYENFNISTNNTIPCTDGYWFNTSRGITIVTEWGLVCGKEIYVQLSSTMFFAGKLCGAFVISVIADQVGRKWAAMGSYAVFFILSVLQIFSQGYIMYGIIRFFTAWFQVGAFLSTYTLLCESMPTDSRSWAACMSTCFWSAGIMVMPLVALLFDNWRYLQVAMTIPLLLFFAYYWFLPESVHWLAAKNRLKEAETLLVRAGKMNGVEIPGNCLSKDASLIGSEEKTKVPEKKYTLIDVYKTPQLRVYATVLLLIWITDTMVYYGLGLGVEQMSGNLYLNAFLLGLIEIPAYLLTNICAERYGRIKTICGFHLLVGISLFSLLIVPTHTAKGTDITWLRTTIVTLGKGANSAGFLAMYLYTAEIYPTVVRNSGLGLSSCIARIGSMIAPLTVTLQEKFSWIQPVLFGCLGIFAGLTILVYPETKGKGLPETLEHWVIWKEGEGLQKKKEEELGEEMKEMLENNKTAEQDGKN